MEGECAGGCEGWRESAGECEGWRGVLVVVIQSVRGCLCPPMNVHVMHQQHCNRKYVQWYRVRWVEVVVQFMPPFAQLKLHTSVITSG